MIFIYMIRLKTLLEQVVNIQKEDVKSAEVAEDTSLFSKLISTYSKFLRGEEVHNFLKKIQSGRQASMNSSLLNKKKHIILQYLCSIRDHFKVFSWKKQQQHNILLLK